MEVVILLLITSLFVIYLIPTEEEKQRNVREFRELFPCKPHNWVNKPTGFEDGSTYKVCSNCKFLSGGGYEI